LEGVERGCLVEAWDAECAPAADFAAAEVEAEGADCGLPTADDLAEGGAALAVGLSAQAAVIAGLLEAGEEPAGAVGEFAAATEVDRTLAAGDAVGDAIVGSVADGAAVTVAGNDGTGAGEDLGVLADEVEGEHGKGSGFRVQGSGDGVVGQRGSEIADIVGEGREGETGGGIGVLGVGFELAESNEEGGHLGFGAEDEEEVVHEYAATELLDGAVVGVAVGADRDFGLLDELGPEQKDDAASGGTFEMVGGLQDEALVEWADDLADGLLVLFREVVEEVVVLEPGGEEGVGFRRVLLARGGGFGHGSSPERGGWDMVMRTVYIFTLFVQ